MKNIVNYVNEAFENIQVLNETIKMSWDGEFKSISRHSESFSTELINIAKEKIFERIQQYYIENPRKRNASFDMHINMKINLVTEDSNVIKLIKLFENADISNWMMDLKSIISSGHVIGTTRSKDQVKSIESVTWSEYITPIKYRSVYTSNNVDKNIVTKYKEDFLDCIEATNIDAYIKQVKSFKGGVSQHLQVMYNAVYNKDKVKKLLTKMMNDDFIENAIRKHDIDIKALMHDADISSRNGWSND